MINGIDSNDPETSWMLDAELTNCHFYGTRGVALIECKVKKSKKSKKSE